MEKINILMTLVKSTKGTHVYGNKDSVIPSVYIRKTGLPTPPPQEITITIEKAS